MPLQMNIDDFVERVPTVTQFEIHFVALKKDVPELDNVWMGKSAKLACLLNPRLFGGTPHHNQGLRISFLCAEHIL
ncbi:hypothetical protein SLS56_005173 [Neofusicoccum ribis]|uniref:Uncharacterized protein n=1 Tax=Neofusicoccum ribis TaxID=45134 RepID=A0ABR3SW48_9PEZI